MRELSTCDFCGDAAAAGVYEVVPDDISDVDARRMVLCEGCRDSLSDIVDPLLAAGRSGSAPSETQASPSKAESADSEPAEPSDSVERADSAPAADEGDDAETEPMDDVDAESSESGTTNETTAASESEPVTIEAEAEPTSAEGTEAAATEPPETVEQSPKYETQPVERPPAYGKVVRLVENRDAGIGRRDLEELATGAYELSAAEVDEAIEFALQHGTFEETDGGLRTVPE